VQAKKQKFAGYFMEYKFYINDDLTHVLTLLQVMDKEE
jgi:hypothetical protein